MPDQNVNEWHPKQEKTVHNFVVGIFAILGIGVAATLIKLFVPTIADALGLIQKLLANAISTVITGAVLAAVVWLIWETFSPKGKINGLFAQAYSSFIHNLTVEMLNVDPMSPLKDSLADVKAKKAGYDEQFSKFDGAISTFKSREDDFRNKAAQAEKRARAAAAQAQAATAAGDTAAAASYQQTFKQMAYEQGTEIQTADSIAAMRVKLEPVRAIIVRLQSYSADLIWKLGVDIDNTQAEWEMANQMTDMQKAASGIIMDGGKSGLALEAQKIVQTKYATAIGRLENLSDLAKPLLDSADLDKATFSQDLLAKWQAEDASSPLLVTAQVVQPALAAPSQSAFTGLIGR
jgi:hypothetical protein